MLCMVEIKLLDRCSSHRVKAAKLDSDEEGIFRSILCETSNLKIECSRTIKVTNLTYRITFPFLHCRRDYRANHEAYYERNQRFAILGLV